MPSNDPQVATQDTADEEVGIRRVNEFFVNLVKRYLPDPYLLAIILTMITFVMALILTDRPFTSLLGDWYGGIFDLFVFILQALLVAVTGFALAQAPVVSSLLDRVARIPKTQAQAGVTVMLATAVASLLSWGLGLVTAAIMSRQIAKQMPVNYGYLVAAAYGGFMVWASGVSSTIALAIATPGSSMNVIEQETGVVTPLTESILPWWNVLPVILLLIALSLYYYKVAPRGGMLSEEDQRKLAEEDEVAEEDDEESDETPARRMENSPVFTLVLVALMVGYFAVRLSSGDFNLGLNELIAIFFLLGWLAHRRPTRYIRTFQNSIRAGGPIALQFPLYGGLMGVMVGSGLSEVIGGWFVAFSSAATLPFWSFISSIIISLFIPSGGGHWVVQGPFMAPAASELGADQSMTAMGVAYGEQVANMLQPFWALPILAIVGLGIRQVMGYEVLAFVIGTLIFGATLLLAGFIYY
ncbi:MAG: TIGR00366 family protein [Actinomycetota bacterium]|nr:TIGR00366 family protein [Actinomycetota bacterium]